MNPRDVPSPIDFHHPAKARAWMERTTRIRPWRPQFFEQFAATLAARSARPLRILELGSGPGLLAKAVIQRCQICQYLALDFSNSMHALAREQLGSLAGKVKFVTRDFRQPEWTAALGKFDAVLTLQAAHETRHSARLPRLLLEIHRCLKCGGVFLYCDHYRGKLMNPVLYLEREAQPAALRDAGFRNVKQLLDRGGMALYRAIA